MMQAQQGTPANIPSRMILIAELTIGETRLTLNLQDWRSWERDNPSKRRDYRVEIIDQDEGPRNMETFGNLAAARVRFERWASALLDDAPDATIERHATRARIASFEYGSGIRYNVLKALHSELLGARRQYLVEVTADGEVKSTNAIPNRDVALYNLKLAINNALSRVVADYDEALL